MVVRLKLLLGVILLGGVTIGILGTNVVAFDDDNVTEVAEVRHGTDALSADTDGDGVADGIEMGRDTDPLESDTDGDGLDDSAEVEYDSNATLEDTDGDGLDDGKEVHEYGTDPTIEDTDDDGLIDRVEVRNQNTDPTVEDTDGDGLTDGDEVHSHRTDPLVTDTDGDSLSDHSEVTGKTDPTNPDTDDDGLDDGEEQNWGTDPTAEDTDGDGLKDSSEVQTPALEDADPLQMDVFIELDWMRGEKPSRATIQKVVEVFDEAPVKNADGSTGINLHITFSDEVDREENAYPRTVFEKLRANMENEYCGYYYSLAVEKTDRDDTIAYTLPNHKNKPIAFKTDAEDGYYYPDGAIGTSLMHEIGHVLEISNEDYRGVDSRDVDYDKYTSAMNYNAPADSYKFSSGKPFDDWEHISENMNPPEVQGLLCNG